MCTTISFLFFWELRLIHSGDQLVTSGVSSHGKSLTSAESSDNPLPHGNIKYWVNRTARVTLEVREERWYSNIPACMLTPRNPIIFPLHYWIMELASCWDSIWIYMLQNVCVMSHTKDCAAECRGCETSDWPCLHISNCVISRTAVLGIKEILEWKM